MVSGALDVTYTITVDATLVMAVAIYHVLLGLLLHVMRRPGKMGAPTPPTTLPEPQAPSSAPTETDLVTCRAPLVFFSRKEGECYHVSRECHRLRHCKSVGHLRPCPDCIACCTMHKKK